MTNSLTTRRRDDLKKTNNRRTGILRYRYASQRRAVHIESIAIRRLDEVARTGSADETEHCTRQRGSYWHAKTIPLLDPFGTWLAACHPSRGWRRADQARSFTRVREFLFRPRTGVLGTKAKTSLRTQGFKVARRTTKETEQMLLRQSIGGRVRGQGGGARSETGQAFLSRGPTKQNTLCNKRHCCATSAVSTRATKVSRAINSSNTPGNFRTKIITQKNNEPILAFEKSSTLAGNVEICQNNDYITMVGLE